MHAKAQFAVRLRLSPRSKWICGQAELCGSVRGAVVEPAIESLLLSPDLAKVLAEHDTDEETWLTIQLGIVDAGCKALGW